MGIIGWERTSPNAVSSPRQLDSDQGAGQIGRIAMALQRCL